MPNSKKELVSCGSGGFSIKEVVLIVDNKNIPPDKAGYLSEKRGWRTACEVVLENYEQPLR